MGWAGLDDFDRLRVQVTSQHNAVAFGFDRAPGQCHALGGGRSLVQHGGVGDRHAGQVGHHGLEVDQRLHAALRNLGLIRGVGRVPGGVLEDVAQDDARRVRAVVALADKTFQNLILAGDGLELGQCSGFGHRSRKIHGLGASDGVGHHIANQGIQCGLADRGQHFLLLIGVWADMAGNEFARVFQRLQRSDRGGGDISMGGTYSQIL